MAICHSLAWRFIFFAFALGLCIRAIADDVGSVDPLDQAADKLRAGSFAEAIPELTRLLERVDRSGDRGSTLRVLMVLAAAQQGAGQFAPAGETLDNAILLATGLGDPQRLSLCLSMQGTNLAMMQRWESARTALERGLAVAESQSDPRGQAIALNGLAGLYVAKARFVEAVEHYLKAADFAAEAGESTLRVEALSAAALASARNAQPGANELITAARNAATGLDDSYPKACSFLKLGRACHYLAGRATSRQRLDLDAVNLYSTAGNIARTINHLPLFSYTLAMTAEVYAAEGRVDDALRLACRAGIVVQQACADPLLYRWQWQSGRYLRDLGRTQEALETYQRAVRTLSRVRSDVAIGFGNLISEETPTVAGRASAFEQIYLELTDLLLQRAAKATEPAEQADLRSARAVMESLKTAQLEDYFKSECATRVAGDVRDIDSLVDPGIAVIYFIPLPDRIEILVSLNEGRIVRRTAAVGRDQLLSTVSELRHAMEVRTSHRYKVGGKQVYDWLITPIVPTLEEEGIHTLVFVAEAELRALPMSGLWDGTGFLVERYALGVVPGLSLVRSGDRPVREVLAAGVSQAQGGFEQLQFIEAELARLRELYDASLLLDSACTLDRLRGLLDAGQFSIVHLASHGEFRADAKESFVLLHGSSLNLTDLARLIQPNQFRGAPVDLLALSACQTAAGDGRDRAALGLAGVAVEAGARSALATLWYVNDRASAGLIGRFYSVLYNERSRGKAHALQQAQLMVLKDPDFSDYRHPCYWAPYLLVGDWR